MEHARDRALRRWRAIALLAVGVALGVTVTSPAGAHFGSVFTFMSKHGDPPYASAGSKTAAAGALTLGRVDLSDLQRKCARGAIRGYVVIKGSASFPSAYTKQSGFNCTGGAIKARRTGGESSTYYVRFAGNSAPVAFGNAFLVSDTGFAISYITVARGKDPLDGRTSFRVAVCQPFGGNCVEDGSFVLVIA